MIYLKTKIRGVFRIVEIENGENDLFLFLKKVFAAHNIDFEQDVTVGLFENDGAPVNANQLFPLIEQNYKCASSWIEIIPSGETHKRITFEVNSIQYFF